MPVVELTAYLDVDLGFSRGETPAFRLEFTDSTPEDVASWVFTAPIRRSPLAAPYGFFDVTVEGTSVTFSLTTAVTETLPDHLSYEVRLANGTSLDVIMGGRLLLRSTEVC